MHESWRCSVTDAEVLRIATEIDRQGYGTLVDYVSEEELQPLRTIAQGAVSTTNGEYIHFTGVAAFGGTVLLDLQQSPAFKELCRRLYNLGTAKAAPEADFYTIVRCLKGRSGQRNSYRFHFDSYVLTALLPVVIPNQGPAGDLVIIPAARPIRRSYIANLLDKVIIDSVVCQLLLRLAAFRRRFGAVVVPLRPGTMYFFWGYRSIHANEPCDADKLRTTALFHFGDPHHDSRARALIRRWRPAYTRIEPRP